MPKNALKTYHGWLCFVTRQFNTVILHANTQILPYVTNKLNSRRSHYLKDFWSLIGRHGMAKSAMVGFEGILGHQSTMNCFQIHLFVSRFDDVIQQKLFNVHFNYVMMKKIFCMMTSQKVMHAGNSFFSTETKFPVVITQTRIPCTHHPLWHN